MRKQAYSILVHNNPGLLSRMAGLFSRRGYNIESITAGTTADPRFTRITIVASGDEQILSQIEKQVRKMEDVIDIALLNDSNSVCRELMMIKISTRPSDRADLASLADIFRAKIVDVEKDCMIIELTGTQSKVDAFMELLDGYEILSRQEPVLQDCAEEQKELYMSISRSRHRITEQAKGSRPLTRIERIFRRK